MQAFRPTNEKTGQRKTGPFRSISPFGEETDAAKRDSVASVDEEAAYLSPRWNIGVAPRRVTVYVVIALLAGFGLGWGASHFISIKSGSPQLSAGTGKQPDLPADPTAPAGSNEFHRVTRITRGDTIEVEGIGPVRMVGIETPDGKPPQELYGRYGLQAVKLAETMLLNEEVRLEPESATRADGDRTQPGQTVAYVYKRDGTLVNGEMLKQGLALVRSGEEFRLSDQFRSLEREAMQSLRGIWGASAVGPAPR